METNIAGMSTVGSSVPFDPSQWRKGGISTFEQTCFAQYWNDLPNVIANDGESSLIVVDPFDFRHRMTLGKYIIENTGSERIWGKEFTGHWCWGYLAQLDWQWRSGRLNACADDD